MTIKQALQNPFALVAQGFIAGAVLFFTTAPQEEEVAQPAASAIIAENIDA